LKIAAYDGETVFNAYSVPTVPIKPAATEKTGLTSKRGELFLRGKKVNTMSKEAAFQTFLSYLENLKNKNSVNEPCCIILVGHNVLR